MTLGVQSITLFILVGSGVILGAIHDFYRVVLREWRFLRFLSATFDFLFWVGALLFVFLLLLKVNHADFRFYIYALLLIGVFIYRITLRTMVMKGTVGLVIAITWIVQTIARLVYNLLIRPILLILKGIYRLLLAVDKLAKGIENVIITPFEWIIHFMIRALYWMFSPLIRLVQNSVKPILEPIKKKWEAIVSKWEELKSFLSKWLFDKNDRD